MDTEDFALWLSWCIEEYSAEKHQPSSQTARDFKQNGVMDYLYHNAEILHTQGKNYIMSSIEAFIQHGT